MNRNGTLKKRRCKNLKKVNGLSSIPYHEKLDVGQYRQKLSDDILTEMHLNKSANKPQEYTVLRLSSRQFAEYRKSSNYNLSSRGRVTRDPNLHSVFDLETNANGYSAALKGTGGFTETERPEAELMTDGNHFFTNSAMHVLKLIIKIGAMFFVFPWTWNNETKRIDRRGDRFVKYWRLQLHFTTAQTLAVLYLQMETFINKLYSASTSNRTAFMGTGGILFSCVMLMKNLQMYFFEEQTRIYINGLLQFNQTHVRKYVIQLDDYKYPGAIVFRHWFLCFHLVQIPMNVSLFIQTPFRPWYLFSYVYPKPWYWLIPGAIHEMIMIGQSVTLMVLIPWIIVAHTNSLRFWVSESHNGNESDNTSDDLRTSANALRAYRALEVLNICFNECMAPTAIPIFLSIEAATVVNFGYVMVRSLNSNFVRGLPGILSFPVAMTTAFIKAFLVISLAAEVSDLGCSFLNSWSLTKHKDFRRILMSCPTLKIWTAKFYFITVSTTITFFKEVFNFITNCVITFP